MTATAKRATKITPQEAASLVKSGMWLDFGLALGQPDEFDKALAARVLELSDVKIRSCLSVKARAFLEAHLPSDPALFSELHAVAVAAGKAARR